MSRKQMWCVILCLMSSAFLLPGCHEGRGEAPSRENTDEVMAGQTAKEKEITDASLITAMQKKMGVR